MLVDGDAGTAPSRPSACAAHRGDAQRCATWCRRSAAAPGPERTARQALRPNVARALQRGAVLHTLMAHCLFSAFAGAAARILSCPAKSAESTPSHRHGRQA